MRERERDKDKSTRRQLKCSDTKKRGFWEVEEQGGSTEQKDETSVEALNHRVVSLNSK